jgi:caffeoyl-CoA O-methyltransferase
MITTTSRTLEMSRKTITLTDELYQYLLSISLHEPSILRRLREETASYEQASMQIAPEQGQFMALLVVLMGARRVLELGTFTGYSSLCMAMAMPPHGRIVTCDASKEWTAVARRYWQEAGVESRVELRLGPALDTLDKLLAEGNERKFDLVFIDADKENYLGYYEYSLKLLRPGGLVLVDNVLWSGKVIEPDMQDKDTVAIRTFNEYLKKDTRITLSVLPLADGLTLAVKN